MVFKNPNFFPANLMKEKLAFTSEEQLSLFVRLSTKKALRASFAYLKKFQPIKEPLSIDGQKGRKKKGKGAFVEKIGLCSRDYMVCTRMSAKLKDV